VFCTAILEYYIDVYTVASGSWCLQCLFS
jgi:hypothetical protein